MPAMTNPAETARDAQPMGPATARTATDPAPAAEIAGAKALITWARWLAIYACCAACETTRAYPVAELTWKAWAGAEHAIIE